MGYTWDNFTERARVAVKAATDRAVYLGLDKVSPDNLLFGLLADEGNVACRLLDRIGVGIRSLRDHLGATPIGDSSATVDETTLSAESDAAIRFAYDEASLRADMHIGTEHLLLGILIEGKGSGAAYLIAHAIDSTRVRDELNRVVAEWKASKKGDA